jgi:post-GPI attachment to proteins factor 3
VSERRGSSRLSGIRNRTPKLASVHVPKHQVPMRASLALLLSFFVLSALASAGDRDEIFQKCVAELERTICTPPRPISILSRLTSWHCVDECKYECMHAITDLRQNKGEQMLQYYGKWPFWRVLSMQEPASVAFSVLNFLIHLRGARLIRKRIIDTHPMKKYYVNWSYISMNAWIWSSVFHTRGAYTISC